LFFDYFILYLTGCEILSYPVPPDRLSFVEMACANFGDTPNSALFGLEIIQFVFGVRWVRCFRCRYFAYTAVRWRLQSLRAVSSRYIRLVLVCI